MSKKTIFLLTILFALTGVVGATNYYVTKTGSDSRNGRSWADAWATVNKVNYNISAGDTVLFGTGTWYNSQIRPPTGGSYSVRTLYSCSTLTTATKFLSKIYSGDSLTGWTQYGGNIWRAYYGKSKSYCLVQDDNLMLHGESSLGAVGEGDFYHSTSSGYVYVWLHGHGNPNDHEMLISNRSTVNLSSTLSANRGYCTFYGLDLRYGQPAVIHWSGTKNADSVFFEYCHVKFGSNAYGENPAVIHSGWPGAAEGNWDTLAYGYYNKVYACSIGTAIRYGGWLATHNGMGMSLYGSMHFYVDSNYFYDIPDDGIQCKQRSWLVPHNRGIVIRNNTFDNMGRSGVYFSNSNLYDSAYGNIIINPGRYGFEQHDWHADDSIPAYLFIANNTIYNPDSGFIKVHGKGRVEANKIMYNVGYSDNGIPWCDITFHYSEFYGTNPWTIDSNIWHNADRNFLGITPQPTTYRDFSSWQSYGNDVNGDTTDPGLNDPANDSFSRPSASGEMDITYGGKRWTVFGAVQSDSDCQTPGPPSLASPSSGATSQTQPVYLDWHNVSGVTGYQVQVDNNSNFGSPVIILHTTQSYHYASGLSDNTTCYWRVRAQNDCGWGAWSSSRYFTTSGCPTAGPPTLTTPSNGATDRTQPVFLDWNNISGVIKYQVQVDNNSNFGSPVIDQQPTISNYNASGLADNTAYYWRVRAQDSCGWGSWSSSSRHFATSGCDTPGPPTLATPSNGATDRTQPVYLDWYDVSGATKYEVLVDNNSNFGSPEIDQQPTVSDYNASGLANHTTYYWRVRAQNNCGWGGWSSSRYFATDGCATPAPPSLVTPLDGATDEPRPVYFDWNYVSGATKYEVKVDNNSNFGSPEIDQELTSTDYDASGLDTNTTYYWRVRAQNSCGWGDWSTTRFFTTEEGPDKIPPGPIKDLGATGDSSWLDEGEILLSWTAPGDDGYEGTASHYDIWYSREMKSEGLSYDSPPNPNPVGTRETFVMTGLIPGELYYIALEVYDEAGNKSAHSNVVSAVTNDGYPLRAVGPTPESVLRTSHPLLTVQNLDSSVSNIYRFELSTDSGFIDTVANSPPVPQQEGNTTSWQVTEPLMPGQVYYWRARANDLSFSRFLSFTVHPMTHAYPNPFDLSETTEVTFTGLPQGSAFVLMTVSGTTVKRWDAPGRYITWDGTNESGRQVASGTYLWFAEGTGIQGKLVVIR